MSSLFRQGNFVGMIQGRARQWSVVRDGNLYCANLLSQTPKLAIVTAYNFFVKRNFPPPPPSITERMRLLGARWREMDKEARRPYVEEFNRYLRKMEEMPAEERERLLERTHSRKQARRNARAEEKKIGKRVLKAPPSSWLLFLESERKRLEPPKGLTESKKFFLDASSRWRTMGAAEREPYIKLQRKLSGEFYALKAAMKKDNAEEKQQLLRERKRLIKVQQKRDEEQLALRRQNEKRAAILARRVKHAAGGLRDATTNMNAVRQETEADLKLLRAKLSKELEEIKKELLVDVEEKRLVAVAAVNERKKLAKKFGTDLQIEKEIKEIMENLT